MSCFLLQGTIADLFAEPSGLDSLSARKPVASASGSSVSALPANTVAPSLNEKQFEQVTFINDSLCTQIDISILSQEFQVCFVLLYLVYKTLRGKETEALYHTCRYVYLQLCTVQLPHLC